jgi:glycosyltransferase involved in cell wall biosynthesis
MIKILHISTHSSGGAGIAAYRLHLALSGINNVQSKFLQREIPYYNSPYHTGITATKHSLYHRIMNKIGLPTLEWHKNNNLINKLPNGSYEKISFPCNDFKVEEHAWVKEADIIHLHWISDFVNYPTFFEAIKNKRVVWTLHDMNSFKGLFHYEEDERINRDFFFVEDQKIKALKKDAILKLNNLTLVSPSRWMAKKANESDLFKYHKIHIIPYSLTDDWFEPIDRYDCRQHLNSELPVLLFVAADIDVTRKGIHLFKDAVRMLPENSVQILIVGNKDFDFPNQKTIKLGFISNETELRKIYASADFFVLPSQEDNLPNVMLEAFAQGLPIVSYKNGGMVEYIKDGKTGYIADELNTEELGKAISSMIEALPKINRSDIQELAKDNFNQELQASSYIKLYNDI